MLEPRVLEEVGRRRASLDAPTERTREAKLVKGEERRTCTSGPKALTFQ